MRIKTILYKQHRDIEYFVCRYSQSESHTIKNGLLTQTEISQTLFCANEISGTVAVFKLILINKSFSDNSLKIQCIKVSNFFKN